MTEEARHEVLRLTALGSPYHHKLAADRLLAMSAINPEDRHVLLELVETWLKTWWAIGYHMKHTGAGIVPIIEDLRKDLGGAKDMSDLFDEEIKAVTGRAPQKQGVVRPSPVPQPGSLENLRASSIASEDEFRANILASNDPDLKGMVPPLFGVNGDLYYGFGLRERLYWPRRIERSWSQKADWDPDHALMEDYLLLITSMAGQLTSHDRVQFSLRLLPYTRSFTYEDCYRAGQRAVEFLERTGLFERVKPKTWKVAKRWMPEIKKQLLTAWLDACPLSPADK